MRTNDTAGRARRRRRRIIMAIGIPLGLLLIVTAGMLASLQALVGAPPARLALPVVAHSAAATAAVDGTWNAGDGSVVGYRLQELVLGQRLMVTGRTSRVWGS